MWYARPRIQSWNHPEHKSHWLLEKQQAEQMNRTIKHKNPVLPSSWTGAHWKLAYGKYGWPQYCSYDWKLMRNEEIRLTCSKNDVSTTPSANVSAGKFARESASANVHPSDSSFPTAVIPLMILTKLSSTSASPHKIWQLRAISSPLRWFKKSQTHSPPSRTTTGSSGTTQVFGAKLTVEAFLTIANSSQQNLAHPQL